MAWLCTTIAGSMPILVASCRAAPSAFGPAGIGRVNDVCTMPSPVVSPYGRTIEPSGIRRLLLEQFQGRVVGVGTERDDAVETLAAVRGALGDAERAVGDRLDEALGVVGDPAEQVDRLGEHGVRAAVDEAAGRGREVLGEVAGGVQHVPDVAQREIP